MISKITAASVKDLFNRLAQDEDGVEVVESVLVIGLIAVGCLIAMKAVAIKISLRWSDVDGWM
jgi:Flp pilus assembly pilin Flp